MEITYLKSLVVESKDYRDINCSELSSEKRGRS